MASVEKLLETAIESLKILDARAGPPESWKARAEALKDAAPSEIARFALELLGILNDARSRALERVARADAGFRELLAFVAGLPAENVPAADPGLVEVPPAAAEPVEAEPAAPTPDEAPTLASLHDMEALLPLAEPLPVDPADPAFIQKSAELMAKVDEGDADMEAKILYNCVWQLEGIAEKYGAWKGIAALGGPYTRLDDALIGSRRSLVSRLKALGFQLFPREAGGRWEDLVAAVGKEALVAVPVLSDREKSAVLGIARSGVRKNGETVEKARVLVSLGESEAAAVLEYALTALARTKPADAGDRKELGRSIKEMWKYIVKLPSQPDGFTFARFAVNQVHDRNRKDRFKGVIQKIVRFLEGGGYQEIMVPVGDVFDDSFSPGKYERKRVPSDRPAGTILNVARRGFLDSQGTPIQKAVVEVSRG